MAPRLSWGPRVCSDTRWANERLDVSSFGWRYIRIPCLSINPPNEKQLARSCRTPHRHNGSNKKALPSVRSLSVSLFSLLILPSCLNVKTPHLPSSSLSSFIHLPPSSNRNHHRVSEASRSPSLSRSSRGGGRFVSLSVWLSLCLLGLLSLFLRSYSCPFPLQIPLYSYINIHVTRLQKCLFLIHVPSLEATCIEKQCPTPLSTYKFVVMSVV